MANQALTKWFKTDKFKHIERVDQECLNRLDLIREEFELPIVITDDAREEDENPSGGAGDQSLHRKGRAFDLRVRDYTPQQYFALLTVIILLAQYYDWNIQLELVSSAVDKHLHIGWYEDGETKPSTLTVRAD